MKDEFWVSTEIGSGLRPDASGRLVSNRLQKAADRNNKSELRPLPAAALTGMGKIVLEAI